MPGYTFIVTSPLHSYVVVGQSKGSESEIEATYRPTFGNKMEIDMYPCVDPKQAERLFMMLFERENIVFDMYKKQYHDEYRNFFKVKIYLEKIDLAPALPVPVPLVPLVPALPAKPAQPAPIKTQSCCFGCR